MLMWYYCNSSINTLRPRQNGRHFADDILKCIFLNENVWISIKISLKHIPTDPINNISALVPIMACRRPGDKPLSEPMIVSLPTHICVARPQWVNGSISLSSLCRTAHRCLSHAVKDTEESVNTCWVYNAKNVTEISHWGQDKMATVYQTTFSNAFSWMKRYEFRLRFHWSWFLRVQ